MFTWLYDLLGTMLARLITHLDSFVLAVLGFTLFTKLILLPLGIIQHRSTIHQMRVRPREEAIRRQFAGDNMKINQEITALYQENNISMASGCLPLLVQLPIMIGLYKVIMNPLTYVLKMPIATIEGINNFLNLGAIDGKIVHEAIIAQGMTENYARLVQEGIIKAGTQLLNFEFFGVNLSAKPTLALNALLLIPIFSGVTAFLQSYYQNKTTPPAAAAQNTQRQLLITMPLVSVWIAFTMPATMGLYWGFSNLLTILQTFIFNLVKSPRKALEEARAAEEQREEAARQRRAASKKVNLGGLRPGEQPPEREVAEEEEERPRPADYGKHLKKLAAAIPDPFDDGLTKTPAAPQGGRRKKKKAEGLESEGDVNIQEEAPEQEDGPAAEATLAEGDQEL
ncbi:MAG: YidC/Oxa1 family membrane protein insertase [Clostridiales bacterium]|nr:YidC/Oxa1 family membrane protein insertase [Clostridiales bacterium]